MEILRLNVVKKISFFFFRLVTSKYAELYNNATIQIKVKKKALYDAPAGHDVPFNLISLLAIKRALIKWFRYHITVREMRETFFILYYIHLCANVENDILQEKSINTTSGLEYYQ